LGFERYGGDGRLDQGVAPARLHREGVGLSHLRRGEYRDHASVSIDA
jgi:hypothetical protein